MYTGPLFKTEEQIRRYLNGRDIYADFEEFKKLEYPKGGRFHLQVCKTDEIELKYFYDGTIVKHYMDGITPFITNWTNIKNLRFDDKLYSTNDDFDWNRVQNVYLKDRPRIGRPYGLNTLLCLDNVYPIPLDLSRFTEITINDLDFGDYPMLKDYLIEQNLNSHPMSYYLRYPDCPIDRIIRYVENKKFPKFKNGEMEYDDCWGNPLLIEYSQKSRSNYYIEYIHNLDFDKEENLEMWSRILFSLYNEEELHRALFGYKTPYFFCRKDNLHIGLHFGNFEIPGVFLDMLRKRIIPLYEIYQKKEKERLLEKERLEKQRKEEEERNKDFNLKNKHGKDANVYTDNNHFYLGSQKLIGTTRIISNFFPTFDAEYWAGIKAPLMGKTPQQLLDEWDRKGKESAEAGTKLHQRIDDYYHHKEIQTDDKDYALFKLFANAYKLNPYRSEWAIYDEDSGIVGVVDMLDCSNGEYILYDWKRSEKVVEGGQPIAKNKFDEHGLKPIENVPNTDYWHYALQLSFYRYILEKNYGIRIKESRLVVLHPTLNLPVVLTTPYMIDEVNKIIAVMKM